MSATAFPLPNMKPFGSRVSSWCAGWSRRTEIAELRKHTEDLMQGRLPEQSTEMAERDTAGDGGVTMQRLEAPPAHLSPVEKAQYFLRIHMLHRKLELHERYLLHPRVLDVLEVLIGPDVLAMQTMLFLKPPGKPGQGWHQDTLLHPDPPRHAHRRVDRHRRLRRAERRDVDGDGQPASSRSTRRRRDGLRRSATVRISPTSAA